MCRAFLLVVLLFVATTAAPVAFAEDPPPTGAGEATVVLAALRVEAAVAITEVTIEAWLIEGGPLDGVYTWSLRQTEAQSDAGKPGAWSDHLGRMIELERAVSELVMTGRLPSSSAKAAAYYVADARYREAMTLVPPPSRSPSEPDEESSPTK